MLKNLKVGLVRCMMFRLPNRIKRVVLLSSFYAYLLNIDYSGFKDKRFKELQPVVEKFNDLLSMQGEKETVLFPMYVKELIWNDLIRDEVRHYGSDTQSAREAVRLYRAKRYTELLKLLDYIVETAPKWLMYTNDQYALKKDLLRVVEIVAQEREREAGTLLSSPA